MHVPGHVCRALANEHRYARLGWEGWDQTPEDIAANGRKLNYGTFVLLQLYHRRDYGKEGEKTFREPWNNRGPIFAADGSTKLDYDPLQRQPVCVAKVSVEDVYSGKIINLVRKWKTSVVARIYNSARTAGKALERQFDEVGRGAGENLWNRTQKSGGAVINTPRKSHKPSLNQVRADKGQITPLQDKFIPPEPKGGFSKHLEK